MTSILVNVSVLKKDIHGVESVATTELQQIPTVLVQKRKSMLSNHTLPCSVSIPMYTLKSSMRTGDSEGDILTRSSFTSSKRPDIHCSFGRIHFATGILTNSVL